MYTTLTFPNHANMAPDMRFTAPGTTSAVLALPLAYAAPKATAFADAC